MNWRCWFWHLWQIHQHFFTPSDDDRVGVVIAWAQCERCAKSKLIHILK